MIPCCSQLRNLGSLLIFVSFLGDAFYANVETVACLKVEAISLFNFEIEERYVLTIVFVILHLLSILKDGDSKFELN